MIRSSRNGQEEGFETPVVLLVFNRPEHTRRILQAIGRVRPKRLYVVADGPRTPKEADLCSRTRAVLDEIDWDCEVQTDFSEVNLGCRQRSASGWDRVFSQVDEAIFLDDDCLPEPTFFRFCEEILERYRDDERVMMVTGSNYLERWKDDRQSYHFSYFGSPWGWASWKRAWRHYDVMMSGWGVTENRERIRDVLGDGETYELQAERFTRIHSNPANRHSWDVPWTYSRLFQSGLTVVPAVNLIRNIGCEGESDIPPDWPTASLGTFDMTFPLRHPASVSIDRLYDLRHIRRATGRDELNGKPLPALIERAPHLAVPGRVKLATEMKRRIALPLRQVLDAGRSRVGRS